MKRIRNAALLIVAALLMAGCAGRMVSEPAPETRKIPEGAFIMGSDAAEREAAYRLDETAYGHSRTRADFLLQQRG